MQQLLNHSESQPRMASGIVDLGGRTLLLDGGEYLLSKPVRVPPLYGNVHLRDGTLRAAANFPRNQHLVIIGDDECVARLPDGSADKQGSCNEFVSLSSIMLDASHVAAGGIHVSRTMGATVGPAAFFIGFTVAGLRIDDGHEVTLVDSWLAACYWSDTHCKQGGASAESVAVEVNGNDHVLSNVIVFDFAQTGVQVNGAANLLSGVHTWNGGGVGIALGSKQSKYGAHQNRLIGCYLDYHTLDLYSPSSTAIVGSFFLHTQLVLHAEPAGVIDGLDLLFNSYTANTSVLIDGTFERVTGVRMLDEMGASRATRAKRTLWLAKATVWRFDFSDVMLFPHIQDIVYSVVAEPGQPWFHHVARPPSGCVVLIETSVAVSASITVEVSQAA